MQTSIRQSQSVSNQQLTDQFREFFNTNRYELRGRDNHTYFGTVDVYHMNDRDAQLVRDAKTRQVQNSYTTQSNRLNSSQHGIRHRAPLGAYNCNIHRLLPERVAVKTISVGSVQAQQIRDYINSYQGHNLLQQYRTPEFTRIYAADETNEGLKVYFEYIETLNEDIQARQQQNNPYSEELLWKLLSDLISASTRLNPGQSLNDIRPTRVLFHDYQASVLPFDLGTNRDVAISQKWNNGESIFYSQQLLNQLQDEQQQNRNSIRQSQFVRGNFSNESFQIGLTVLAAGLLLTEEQVQVNNNKGFNQQRLTQLIQDFSEIYNRRDRFLSFFLSELLLSNNRLSPSAIHSILNPNNDSIQFLESDFKNSVRQYLERETDFVRVQSQLPLTNNNSQLVHLWDRYRSHFYLELVNRENSAIELRVQRNNEETERIIREQERKNQLILSQPNVRRIGTQSSQQVTSSIIRNSQLGSVQASNYPTQFARESQNVQQSVFRQSQQIQN